MFPWPNLSKSLWTSPFQFYTPLPNDEDDTARSKTRPSWHRATLLLLLIITLLGLFGIALFLFAPLIDPPLTPHVLDPSTASPSIRAFYARQSTTLAQARARYTLRTGREPPPSYNAWFDFARERRCIIDDYTQIDKDFAPFYQAERAQPGSFKSKVQESIGIVALSSAKFRGGKVSGPRWNILRRGPRIRAFRRISRLIPDTMLVINERDEPRVVFDHSKPSAFQRFLSETDLKPFRHTPAPTADFFLEQERCLLTANKTGFGNIVNDDHAFLLSSASTDFTTELYPILSSTRISPCFSDILIPSEFYYRSGNVGPQYSHPDTISWSDKKPILYWRGSASGGMIYRNTPYTHFPRLHLLDLARNHSDLIDARITKVYGVNCNGCERTRIEAEYGITGEVWAREREFGFKYLLDLDGNSYSGRYLGLLGTNSLVFKSTAFSEFFDPWLKPYEDFIPVAPDLSDLVSKIKWAQEHDDEAQAIAKRGREFVEWVLTDEQHDCYLARVGIEWARLYNGL